MPVEWLPRGEFEGYVRRHEADLYAHAAFRRIDSEDMADQMGKQGDRLTALERWRWMITGAVAMLTFLASAGIITAVIELLRH